MPYIILGDVGYALLTSPTSYDLEKRADYAEHEVTEGKPLLQYMGPGLDQIALSFTFHADFVDPQSSWDELVGVLDARTAFPVSMGNGLFMGTFVLTELARIATVTDQDGSLVAIDCQVKLKEWVDIAPLETKKAEQKQTAKAVSKPGKIKPKSKKAEVPQVDSTGDYTEVDEKTMVRQ